MVCIDMFSGGKVKWLKIVLMVFGVGIVTFGKRSRLVKVFLLSLRAVLFIINFLEKLSLFF